MRPLRLKLSKLAVEDRRVVSSILENRDVSVIVVRDGQAPAEPYVNAILVLHDLLDLACELHRYETEADYRKQKEMDARAATGGNVTYLDTLVERLGGLLTQAARDTLNYDRAPAKEVTA